MPRRMRPPTTMTAMTGHLQNEAFMQLSQLEKAVLTSVTLPWASLMMSLRDSPATTARVTTSFNWSSTPPRRLLAIATSTDGILSSGYPSL